MLIEDFIAKFEEHKRTIRLLIERDADPREVRAEDRKLQAVERQIIDFDSQNNDDLIKQLRFLIAHAAETTSEAYTKGSLSVAMRLLDKLD